MLRRDGRRSRQALHRLLRPDMRAPPVIYLLDVSYTEDGRLFDVPLITRVCVEADDDQAAAHAAFSAVLARGHRPVKVYGL